MSEIFRNGRPVVGVGDRFQDNRRPAPPTFPPIRRPAPPRPVSPAIRAHETVIARAWRPEWGGRPVGFGAARWRPKWGARPAWFGARQWRREWGAPPAWWGAHITVQQDAPPDDQDDDTQSPAPSDAATPAPSTPSTPSSDAPAPPSTLPTTAAPDAGPAPDGHHAKRGLSTLAKVGIAAGGVVVVGGTIAAIVAASGKK